MHAIPPDSGGHKVTGVTMNDLPLLLYAVFSGRLKKVEDIDAWSLLYGYSMKKTSKRTILDRLVK